MKNIKFLIVEFISLMKVDSLNKTAIIPSFVMEILAKEINEKSYIELTHLDSIKIGGLRLVTQEFVSETKEFIQSNTDEILSVQEFVNQNPKSYFPFESFNEFTFRKAMSSYNEPILSKGVDISRVSKINREHLRKFKIEYKTKGAIKGRVASNFVLGVSPDEVTSKFHFLTDNKNRIISVIDLGYLLGAENTEYEEETPFIVEFLSPMKKVRSQNYMAKSALEAVADFYVDKGLMIINSITPIENK